MEKFEKEMAQVEKKGKLGKGIVALAATGAATSAMATGTWADDSDSFGELLGTFIEWLQGNLGKLLALLGFIGTFIIYLMTHKGSVLFIGIVISLIAGGLVGIVGTFFNAGSAAFEINQ
jgi:type IV secretory pathway VirB2 component (pilin)